MSLSAFGCLVAYYGFPLESDTAHRLISVIKTSFGFYVLHFVIRWFFDFHPLQFLRRSAFEAGLMGLLVIEGISDVLTGKVFLGGHWTPWGLNPWRTGPSGWCKPTSSSS